ncbi:Helix-turn-helix domain-containing protein [Dyadobacter sp. SG02]|uniref:AraC family transcriptional regulator n=1 Tax=Dyadobacter sp. SG02 TaxID=1855291 RepID=UPI0008C7B5E7|nr:helix-turn-helix domain-containing protein [Dyadobacter sp. SG02]SEJ13661.1 Helix-turn-helix domain-containing protein [Dyadobacter sp. SG02]
MQIKPSPLLSGIVRHFLVIENDTQPAMRIFSDGNTGVVFNYGSPLFCQHEIHSGPTRLPASFLYGQLDCYRNVWTQGNIRLLIAVLYPFGAAALLKIPASELRNQILGCHECFKTGTERVNDEIALSPAIHDKIRIAEHFLLSQLGQPYNYNTLVINTIKIIHSQNGLVPVAQLTALTGSSERQLQRKFEEQIGISPKRYAGIVRMQNALRMLRKKSFDLSLAGVACESGFFDQAHLIREMKNLSGLTPGQYLSPQNVLAANLIRLAH